MKHFADRVKQNEAIGGGFPVLRHAFGFVKVRVLSIHAVSNLQMVFIQDHLSLSKTLRVGAKKAGL